MERDRYDEILNRVAKALTALDRLNEAFLDFLENSPRPSPPDKFDSFEEFSKYQESLSLWRGRHDSLTAAISQQRHELSNLVRVWLRHFPRDTWFRVEVDGEPHYVRLHDEEFEIRRGGEEDEGS